MAELTDCSHRDVRQAVGLRRIHDAEELAAGLRRAITDVGILLDGEPALEKVIGHRRPDDMFADLREAVAGIEVGLEQIYSRIDLPEYDPKTNTIGEIDAGT